MKVSPKQYARSLMELTVGISYEDAQKVIERFVLLLQERHDLSKSDAIIEELSLLQQAEQKEIKAELVSARSLSKESKNLITTYLGDRLGVNKINWQEKIDHSLLGGFVLRYHGFVIDGSLKNNLNKFKKQLLIK